MSEEKRICKDSNPSKEFFIDRNFPYVYQIIFSFCENNVTCFSLSLISKQVQKTFQTMIKISSTRRYRLDLLNNENPTQYTFDLFDNDSSSLVRMDYSLDTRFFCKSRDEYTKEFRNDVIVKVLEEVNEKFKTAQGMPVAMISGSFAFINIFKDKAWVKISDEDDNQQKKRSYMSLSTKKYFRGDVDIFILGNEKEKVFTEILRLMSLRFERPDSFSVILRDAGLYDIVFSRRSLSHKAEDVPKLLSKTRRLGYKNIVFQFIIKELHQTPSDVFAFFDLDCCKIGIIPTKRSIRVVTCPAFIRAISYRCNFLDLYLRKSGIKHYQRLCKYYRRTRILTSCVPEPLLSRYHSSFKESVKRYCKSGNLWKYDRKLGIVKNHLFEGQIGIVEWGWWDMDEDGEGCQYFLGRGRGGYYKKRKSAYYDRYNRWYDGDDDDDESKDEYGYTIQEFLNGVESKRKNIKVDMNRESYLMKSVGIVKDKKKNRFVYEPRDFSEITGGGINSSDDEDDENMDDDDDEVVVLSCVDRGRGTQQRSDRGRRSRFQDVKQKSSTLIVID